MDGRRIRILTIVDLWDRNSPAMEVYISLPGLLKSHLENRTEKSSVVFPYMTDSSPFRSRRLSNLSAVPEGFLAPRSHF